VSAPDTTGGGQTDDKATERSHWPSRWPLGWALALLGGGCALVAAGIHPLDARLAASQDWSPFVLVTGLLLVGRVAEDDRLFSAAGYQLARTAGSGLALFVGAAAVVGLVTAILNLDTAVVFLTPVLVYTARSRGESDAPLVYACLLLANAGSLLLPGSNLTNLIVLGHLHISGGGFLAHTWLAWLAALTVTAAVVVVSEHRSLRVSARELASPEPPVFGIGLAAVVSATVLVLVLRSPAIPVALVGVIAVAVRLVGHRQRLGPTLDILGLPVLIGLFGVAVALGVLGRVWSGPAMALSHLDVWATAFVAAVTSVLVNNLPAASLLAARVPHDAFALLVGLDLGPNLFVTGSLAWILWLRAARGAGAQPSVAKAARLGVVAVPLSMVAAVGALVITGSR
jgi:arsenical pump membrane protein